MLFIPVSFSHYARTRAVRGEGGERNVCISDRHPSEKSDTDPDQSEGQIRIRLKM